MGRYASIGGKYPLISSQSFTFDAYPLNTVSPENEHLSWGNLSLPFQAKFSPNCRTCIRT